MEAFNHTAHWVRFLMYFLFVVWLAFRIIGIYIIFEFICKLNFFIIPIPWLKRHKINLLIKRAVSQCNKTLILVGYKIEIKMGKLELKTAVSFELSRNWSAHRDIVFNFSNIFKHPHTKNKSNQTVNNSFYFAKPYFFANAFFSNKNIFFQ